MTLIQPTSRFLYSQLILTVRPVKPAARRVLTISSPSLLILRKLTQRLRKLWEENRNDKSHNLIQVFKDPGCSHTPANTHRNHPIPAPPAFHFVEELGRQFGPGRA